MFVDQREPVRHAMDGGWPISTPAARHDKQGRPSTISVYAAFSATAPVFCVNLPTG
jgi:hypothetical protein